MDNISFLTEILTTEHEYWVVAKKSMAAMMGRYERQKDQILFIGIPPKIDRMVNKKEIKLTQLEDLRRSEIFGNIYLSENYTPFQWGQDFYNIYKGYPIPNNIVNDFLRKAMDLKSNDLYEYKKIIDEIIESKTPITQ